MPTVLEIAQHAGVSVEQVLRVVIGEPVSDDAARRVRQSISVLGPPPYPRPPAAGELEPADDELLSRLTEVTAELEATLPHEVGSVVYEALRVEVRPVAEHIAAMDAVFRGMLERLERLGSEVAAERRERVDDLALQVELIRTSWQSVDRRLGRLERMVERLGRNEGGGERGTVIRLDGLE